MKYIFLLFLFPFCLFSQSDSTSFKTINSDNFDFYKEEISEATKGIFFTNKFYYDPIPQRVFRLHHNLENDSMSIEFINSEANFFLNNKGESNLNDFIGKEKELFELLNSVLKAKLLE